MYFFFDIDGTLQTAGYGTGYVPDSAKEALRLLRAAGHFTAIATGRGYALAEKYLEQLDFDNMVCDGGNGLVLDRKLIGVEPLDHELVNELIDECRRKGFPWGISPEISSVRFVPDNSFNEFTGDIYMHGEIIEGLDPRNYEKIYKAYIACEYPAEFELEALKKLPWCRFWDKYFFVEPCNKAYGIRKMLDIIGGDVKDVVVFGDQKNDLSMFCPEWTSIAMGNAVQELKDKADYVTTDVDKDGIYNACKHFGWI